MLLMGLALVRGLGYAALVPPWQAPDEISHFEFAWHIAQLGRWSGAPAPLPAFERELVASLYVWRFGEWTLKGLTGRLLPAVMPERLEDFLALSHTMPGRFSLAYVWQALFLLPARHEDLVTQLYLARLSSVVLNVLLIGLAWRIYGELGLPQGWAVAATALLVLWPQHTFINATVNEGPLAELAAAVAFWGWARLFARGLRPEGVAAVLGGTMLGLWAKNTAAFLIGWDALAALAYGGYWGLRGAASWRHRWAYLAVPTLMMLSLGALATGTPVGRWAWGRLQAWEPGKGMEAGMLLNQTLRWTWESLWARFGWMNVEAPEGWSGMVLLLGLLAIRGWLFPRSRAWSAPGWSVGMMAAFGMAVLAGWLAFVVGTPEGPYYASQGRYLFPAAIPGAALLAGGWGRWAPQGWGEGARVAGFIGIWALLDAVAWSWALLYYYGG